MEDNFFLSLILGIIIGFIFTMFFTRTAAVHAVGFGLECADKVLNNP